MGATACIAYAIYRRHPHLAEPEPRPGAIAGLPAGRTLSPDPPMDPR